MGTDHLRAPHQSVSALCRFIPVSSLTCLFKTRFSSSNVVYFVFASARFRRLLPAAREASRPAGPAVWCSGDQSTRWPWGRGEPRKCPRSCCRRSFELASPRGKSCHRLWWKLPGGLTVAFSNAPPPHGLPCQQEAHVHVLADRAVWPFVRVRYRRGGRAPLPSILACWRCYSFGSCSPAVD